MTAVSVAPERETNPVEQVSAEPSAFEAPTAIISGVVEKGLLALRIVRRDEFTLVDPRESKSLRG